MGNRTVRQMERRLQKLQQQLGELGPLMRGSVVRIGTKNKQFYFSLNKDKKTRLVYLGNTRVERARTYSKNYKKLMSIVEEMTMLNMELLRQSKSVAKPSFDGVKVTSQNS